MKLQLSPTGKPLAWLEGGFGEVQTVKVTLTREDIAKVPNVVGLLSTFDLLYPTGSVSFTWDRSGQLDLISSPLGRYFADLVHYHVLPLWRMDRMDLRGYDFRLKNLSGCDLTGSRMPRDLRATNLRQCRLSGTDLSQVDLCGANLSGAICDSADFRGSSLVETCLQGVEFTRAKFRGAYFRESTIRHCRFDLSDLRGVVMIDCDDHDNSWVEVIRDDVPNTYHETEYLYDTLGQSHPQYVEDGLSG